MSQAPQKAIIIGLDAATPELVDRFVAEGRMPNIKKLIASGAYGSPFPVMPTHTPVNWTTISTGAWPGTHGVTGFSMLQKGKSLDEPLSAFDTRNVTAEFLWNAAEKVGKKSILLKWGGPNFPVSVSKGMQVDGCFCVECIHEIFGPTKFGAKEAPHTTGITIEKASGWRNLPDSALEPLETHLALGAADRALEANVLIFGSGTQYDSICVAAEKDAANSWFTISAGEWSPWQKKQFSGSAGEAGSSDGTFRIKLLGVEPDGSDISIFCSQIMPTTGWTYPEKTAQELTEHVGPFLQRPGYIQQDIVFGAWADYDTLLEEMDYQHDWYAKAAIYLLENNDWDLFFLHTHAPDYIQDSLIREAEPLTASSPDEAEKNIEYIAETYESCDRMVGKIVDAFAADNPLILIVSDHGCIGFHSDYHASSIVKDILTENGFLFFEGHGGSALDPGSKPRHGSEEVDWSRTKAVFHDSIYIYMNVKGREPYGVVDPSEYENVRDDIIDALRSYKDPRLGSCPFSLILRSEDAEMFGLYGDRVGDIVVAVKEGGEYGEGHGTLIPTAKYGISSLSAILIMSGPGVQEGIKLQRPFWLTDVAPTIAHLLDIPAPDTMEGAVLNEALINRR
jgi:predicted AlkP superfamily phosphohydrolase/phosphomutase